MQRNKIKAGVEYAVDMDWTVARDASLGQRWSLDRVVFDDPTDLTVDRDRWGNRTATYLTGRNAATGETVKVEPRRVLATWAEYEEAQAEEKRAAQARAEHAAAAAAKRAAERRQLRDWTAGATDPLRTESALVHFDFQTLQTPAVHALVKAAYETGRRDARQEAARGEQP